MLAPPTGMMGFFHNCFSSDKSWSILRQDGSYCRHICQMTLCRGQTV
jgi:hypothetical protein